MNPRELLHLFQLRCAADAQWEIRAVAWAMLASSRLVAPMIFDRIPQIKENRYIEEKERRLSEILSEVTTRFRAARPQQVVEIPLKDLNLEYQVKSFVNRL
jgi:thymidylate synthase ThyX